MDYVRLDGVEKSYLRRYGAPTLRAHQSRSEANAVDRALSGITLRIEQGEAVALLGRRRSGRSTLLALLAGLYRPDAGSVLVRGRPTGTAAMSAGFTPTLPVRDNLRLNALLLGMSVEQIKQRQDSIIDFAGLKPAELDYPLRELEPRTRQRLAYSIVLHAEPHVFLADGRVTVGDAAFREASLERLEALRERGHVLVIATNKRPLLRRLCRRSIVLDAGEVVYDGGLKGGFRTLRELRA